MREAGGGHPRDVLLGVAEIEPAVSGPDTLIAWRADDEPRLGPLIAAVRDLRDA